MASCWKPTHSSFRCLLLFVFVLMVTCVGAEGPNSSVEVKQKDGQFDTSYIDNVTSEVQIIYTFNHTVTRNKVSSSQRHNHIMLMISQQALHLCCPILEML